MAFINPYPGLLSSWVKSLQVLILLLFYLGVTTDQRHCNYTLPPCNVLVVKAGLKTRVV
jgi:hypothetical protein